MGLPPTSPPRSSIRRSDRVSERERQRNVLRRAAARIYGPVQRTVSTTDHRPLPWIESATPPEILHPDARHPVPSPLTTASATASATEEARSTARQRLEAQVSGAFGTGWHNAPYGPPGDEENRDNDLGWWSIDPRGRARHPRIQRTPISSRFTRSPDTMVTVGAHPEAPRRSQFPPVRFGNGQLSERNNPTTRRGTGVDGLGDRERSLSPEGWDTLFTTLTPDPQAPSVNTSFASGTDMQSRSQSAAGPFAARSSAARSSAQGSSAQGPFVERPPSEWPVPLRAPTGSPLRAPTGSSILPDGFDDSPLDPGCDSTCEHSDEDEVSAEEPRRSVTSRSRRGDDGRGSRMPRYAQSANLEREAAEERFPTYDQQSDAPRMAERQALNRVGPPEETSWGGRGSMRAEERRNATPGRRARILTFLPGTGPAEEDWDGMQHIMRSLAQREDIPEEWWAEAGLSRTLTQNGTN